MVVVLRCHDLLHSIRNLVAHRLVVQIVIPVDVLDNEVVTDAGNLLRNRCDLIVVVAL